MKYALDILKQLKNPKLYLLWVVQFLILMAGAFCINKVSDSSLDEKQKITYWILLSILGILELAFIAYRLTKKEEDIRENLKTAWLHYDSTEKLNQQITINSQFQRNRNYFKLMLAYLRADTELKKYKSISQAHSKNWVLNSLPMWDYFISVFRSLIGVLVEKDEYLTLSTIEFWNKDKESKTIKVEHSDPTIHRNSNFFETNFLKCLNANVLSKRIIIVNQARLKRGKIITTVESEEEKKDRNYFDAFIAIAYKYSDPQYQHEKFENYFFLTDERTYEELTSEDIPFAIIKRKKYDDRLCVTTYIPGFHREENTNQDEMWKRGIIPKIGFHIALNKTDPIWAGLYEKFNSLYDEGKRNVNGDFIVASTIHEHINLKW